MGKKNKKQKYEHANAFSNETSRKGVFRRHHSQKLPSESGSRPPRKLQNQSGQNDLVSDQGPPRKLRIPFDKRDHVLLVGEGDFSFASSLLKHHKPAKLVATSFDSKDVVELKYSDVKTTLELLQNTDVKSEVKAPGANETGPLNPLSPAESWVHRSGEAPTSSGQVTVVYGIDATKLSSTHKKVLGRIGPFSKIVFNFPHTGGLSTDVNRQVRANQQLLVGFFNAAKPFLATCTSAAKRGHPALDTYITDDEDEDGSPEPESARTGGQILVTLFEGEPYTLWNVRDLARHCGLKVTESFKFPWSAYPGYKHARTVGDITTGKDREAEGKRKGAWRGEERDARTYILILKDAETPQGDRHKRKRNTSDEDSDRQ